jgi:hypothetical protein
MSATDERKALERLSLAYRKLIAGAKPPAHPEPVEGLSPPPETPVLPPPAAPGAPSTPPG